MLNTLKFVFFTIHCYYSRREKDPNPKTNYRSTSADSLQFILKQVLENIEGTSLTPSSNVGVELTTQGICIAEEPSAKLVGY